MPNHVHGIIIICDDVGATQRNGMGGLPPSTVGATRRVAPTDQRPAGPKSGSLGAIVGQFKSRCTKRINRLRGTSGTSIWQRNYYEHIIRDERELDAARRYIEENPTKWTLERDHPENVGPI